MRLDELAHRSGAASTTIRLYQAKGLLPGPRVVGRVGYYDEAHVVRLRLIERLQGDGFSLAGIGRLLATWEDGRDLVDLVGVEEGLGALLTRRRSEVLDPAELTGRFPAGVLTPELVQRAMSLGLVEAATEGNLRVLDRRFFETGAALAHLGIPLGAILDEWERLVEQTDVLAEGFINLFEVHVLPADWRTERDHDRLRHLGDALRRLDHLAGEVGAAALDASIARIGAARLGQLLAQDGATGTDHTE